MDERALAGGDRPAIGSDEWDAWVDRLIADRDEAVRGLRELGLETKAQELETAAELTNLNRAAGTLLRVCRGIINKPLSSRIDVQSKLTLAVQNFEREMGESWTGG